jgi:hypothetical protein
MCRIDEIQVMSLDEARLCIDCNSVHNASFCPTCAGKEYLQLACCLNRATERMGENGVQGNTKRDHM